jgi:chromosome segregation ATPase
LDGLEKAFGQVQAVLIMSDRGAIEYSLPQRLPSRRRNRIISVLLDGYGRNAVSAKTHESGATVSREIERFEKLYDEQEAKVAGGEYKVTEKLDKLIEIATVARERKLELTQLADGADVAEALARNKVEDPMDAVRFVDAVLKLGQEKGFDAHKLMSQCIELDRLTKDYRSFDEIKPQWETIGKELPKKQGDLAEINEEIIRLRRELSKLPQKYSATEGDLKTLNSLREKLSHFDLDIGTLDESLDNLLRNLKDYGLEPEAIASDLKKSETLKSQLETRRQNVYDAGKELERMNASLGHTESELKKTEIILAEVKGLEVAGLSAEDILDIKNVILRISTKRKIDPKAAMNQFKNDILGNYDAVLGLKSQVGDLRETRDSLLKEKEGIVESNKKAISAANKELEGKVALTELVRRIEDSGLSIDFIERIRKSILRISRKRRINLVEATRRFEEEVKKNYDPLLAIEEAKTQYEEMKERLTNDIVVLTKQYDAKKKVLDAYSNLRSRGLDDEAIFRWERVLVVSKLNPRVVEADLKETTGLKKLENEIKANIQESRKKEKTLKLRLGELSTNIQELESEEKKLRSTGNTIGNNLIGHLNSFEKKVNELDLLVSNTSTKTQNEVKEGVETLKSEINTTSETISNLLKTAKETYKNVGRLEPIAKAYSLMSSDAPPSEVFPPIVTLLAKLKKYCDRRRVMLTLDIDDLSEDLIHNWS